MGKGSGVMVGWREGIGLEGVLLSREGMFHGFIYVTESRIG